MRGKALKEGPQHIPGRFYKHKTKMHFNACFLVCCFFSKESNLTKHVPYIFMASGFRTCFISEYIPYFLVISSDAVLTTVYNCLLSPWVCWFLLLYYLQMGQLSLHCSGNLLLCSYQFHLFQEVDYLYPWMPFPFFSFDLSKNTRHLMLL